MEKILVVDDQVEVLEYLTEFLGQSGYRVSACGDAATALATIDREGEEINLAIVDLDLGCGSDDGLRLLREIQARRRDLPVIILTAQAGTRAAVQAMKLGAVDFLEKDTCLLANLTARMKKASEFLAIIRENRRLREETESLRRQAEHYKELAGLKRRIVGASCALRRCLAEAEAVAPGSRPVLIVGERGTGKELVASYIHERSRRAAGPFIAVNCAAFSGNLLESGMFGHEKGAFTVAAGRKPGRLELADGGTLFLDEVTVMSGDFQEMILGAVERQCFEPVQGTGTVEVDVRVLAATSADIDQATAGGELGRDLYERLAFKVIRVPPLRERADDVPQLVEHFLCEMRREAPGVAAKRFTGEALCRLKEYPWPGNIRQLKNVIERLALEADGEEIDASRLGLDGNHQAKGEGGRCPRRSKTSP